PERTDGEPAGRHLPVRVVTLQGLAEARLDRRAHHHLNRAGAQHRCAHPFRVEKAVMNVATVAVPTVTHAGISTTGLEEKISIRSLNFYYGQTKALNDITLSLYRGRVTAFIGPSGCGKSTLLRVLN